MYEPCPPFLTRGYLGPAGCAGTVWRSGWAPLGEWRFRDRAGLSEPCDRPWAPQAGLRDTGRHRPAEATAREVRGAPLNETNRARRSGAVASPATNQGRTRPRVKATRVLPSNRPVAVPSRTQVSSFRRDRPVGDHPRGPAWLPLPTGPCRSSLTTAAHGPFFHGSPACPYLTWRSGKSPSSAGCGPEFGGDRVLVERGVRDLGAAERSCRADRV